MRKLNDFLRQETRPKRALTAIGELSFAVVKNATGAKKIQ
jgi:hypothetical protein